MVARHADRRKERERWDGDAARLHAWTMREQYNEDEEPTIGRAAAALGLSVRRVRAIADNEAERFTVNVGRRCGSGVFAYARVADYTLEADDPEHREPVTSNRST